MTQPSPTRLLIVIVNYRTPRLTVDCLRSLASELAALPQARVVVVDNASGDSSPDLIQTAIEAEGWGAWANLVVLTHNRGYAAGNNAVIRPALAAPDPPDLVLLLNPDTIVRPGALAVLVAFMRDHPTVGIAGSRLEDLTGQPHPSAFRFPSALGELEMSCQWGVASRLLAPWRVVSPISTVAGPTDWVPGACMLIRRAVFEAIGLLDEAYFLCFEDIDFCRRARQAEWACWYVPQSRVAHLVGQSSQPGGAHDAARRRYDHWLAARRVYFLKHHGWRYAALADAAWLVGYPVGRGVMWHRRASSTPPPKLSDFWRHSVLARGA